MRRLFTAVAVAATFLLTLAPAPAGAAEVTEFPFTDAVYNTCNDDMLIINGTLVDSMDVSWGTDGSASFKHRMSWKQVSVTSQKGIDYRVDKSSVDTFSTKLVNGNQTYRDRRTSWLRVTPLDGASGALRVQWTVVYQTNAQGVSRTVDRYTSSCTGPS